MMRGLHEADAALIKGLAFSSVFTKLLKKRRYRISRQREVGVVLADEGSVVLGADSMRSNFGFQNAK